MEPEGAFLYFLTTRPMNGRVLNSNLTLPQLTLARQPGKTAGKPTIFAKHWAHALFRVAKRSLPSGVYIQNKYCVFPLIFTPRLNQFLVFPNAIKFRLF